MITRIVRGSQNTGLSMMRLSSRLFSRRTASLPCGAIAVQRGSISTTVILRVLGAAHLRRGLASSSSLCRRPEFLLIPYIYSPAEQLPVTEILRSTYYVLNAKTRPSRLVLYILHIVIATIVLVASGSTGPTHFYPLFDIHHQEIPVAPVVVFGNVDHPSL